MYYISVYLYGSSVFVNTPEIHLLVPLIEEVKMENMIVNLIAPPAMREDLSYERWKNEVKF